MRIILHIFKKDVRYHWLEAAISVALICMYGWNQPRHWTDHGMRINIFLGRIVEELPLFIVLAWIFMMIRVIQDEALVGDRQFWITRPYEWPKLLAAKVLFAVAFIHAPLLIVQMFLLKLAHFPVVSSIPSLVFIQLFFFVIAIVPSMAIASLNPGIGKTTLTLIGLILYGVGIGALLNWIPGTGFSPEPFDSLQTVPFFVGAVAIVFVQFALRRTRISWVIFGGVLLLVYTLVSLPGIPGFTDKFFPAPTAAHPLPAKFSLDTSVSFAEKPEEKFEFFGDQVRLQFPIKLENFDESTFVKLRGVKLELDLPTGEHWTSPWEGSYEELSSSRTRSWTSVSVKQTAFKLAEGHTVNARLTIAFDVFQLGPTAHLSLNGTSLALPDGVRCKLDPNESQMTCFSALRSLGPYIIQANLPSESCPTRSDRNEEPWSDAPPVSAYFDGGPFPDFDFTPVRESSLGFSRSRGYENEQSSVRICPGTPLLLTGIKSQYVTRAEIDFGRIKLTDYVPSYPLKISPPFKHPPSHNPGDTFSLNLAPPFLSTSRGAYR